MDAFVTYSDEQLLYFLCEKDDERALVEIYRRYWKTLYNQAFKRLKQPEPSEEIVQDVFIDLWTHRKERNIVNLRAYLQTSVRYQVFMIYNRNKNSPAFEEPLEHLISIPPEADSQFFLNELTTAIHDWLEDQPEKRREIFRLRFLENQSTKEIAEELSISQKTVQNQLHNAQSSLRNAVAKFLCIMIVLFS